MPCLKATIKCPSPIKGELDNFAYTGNSVGIEIEITPRGPSAIPKPVPLVQPQPESFWEEYKEPILVTTAVALTVGATVLIVGTIAEDILTAGVGIADDPVSFATAAAMFSRAYNIFKTLQGVAPVAVQFVK